MTYHHIRVEPLSTAVGAEISGVDLAQPPAEPAMAEIRRAFGEHGVVFFRDQELTPDQHLGFARRFGGIDINRFFATVPGYPAIAEVRKEPEQRQNIGNGWHTDHSYDPAPLEAAGELGPHRMAVEVVEQRARFLLGPALEAQGEARVDIERLAAGLRVADDDRVDGILGRKLRVADAAREIAAPGIGLGAKDVAARVQRLQALEGRLQPVGE